MKVFDILESSAEELQQRLSSNVKLFRLGMNELGYKVLGHPLCPIAPIYLGDAKLTMQLSEEMMNYGV